MERLKGLFVSSVVYPLCFFAFVVGFFPFIGEHEGELLRKLATPLFWLMGFLTLLFSFGAIEEGFRDGLFDRWWLRPLSPWQMILRLWGQHLLFFGIPFGGACVFFSDLYGLLWGEKISLILSFGLGLPFLSLLGVFLGILNFGARGGFFLQGLLMFPLAAPLLLLGIGVGENGQAGLFPLSYLGGFLALGLIEGLFAFFLGTWALKQRLLT